MFNHIFTTRIKCLLRDKQLVFWTLMFPIVLATLFKIAFSNLSTGELFKTINIAVINSQHYQNNVGFRGAIDGVSKDGKDKLFNVTFTNETNAEDLLKNSKIEGYIYLNPEVNLVVKSQGLNQTVIKTFLDDYKESASTIATILASSPEANPADLIKDATTHKEYTKEISASVGKPNTTLNYFYALIAMTCLYGGISGLKEITDIQGDLSKRAARINMAPVHKIKMFIYSLCAAFLIQFTEIIIVLGYLHFALKIDFGNQLSYILLLCFVGCGTGISFGAMISALIKKSEGLKIGVLIGTTMIGSFLAGMMSSDIKYLVQKSMPILSYINPTALITDGFYTLYYYNNHGRFFINISILTLLSLVFCLTTYFIIRRQKYASL
ncbi:ABC transporter permease [Clostridium sp. CF012]|uniref:ABC transporter permease n=1 Tax=Clostridium sp. CF012 TaxID=2843319 RepID=UPI001C0DD21E|nr:ABC transporter permease [Clostridium sp. CF012]MBU3142885.1 ABC transporter permease [Clostridium sp. CF012]